VVCVEYVAISAKSFASPQSRVALSLFVWHARVPIFLQTAVNTVLFRPSVQSWVTETSEQNTFRHCHGSPKSSNSVTFYTKKGENSLKSSTKFRKCYFFILQVPFCEPLALHQQILFFWWALYSTTLLSYHTFVPLPLIMTPSVSHLPTLFWYHPYNWLEYLLAEANQNQNGDSISLNLNPISVASYLCYIRLIASGWQYTYTLKQMSCECVLVFARPASGQFSLSLAGLFTHPLTM